MDRKLLAIYALTFTAPLAIMLTLVAAWNLWAGMAAITLTLTAAIVIRPD